MTGARPHAFFALTFALSLPFWAFGAIVGTELLQGLPISAIMVAAPVIAASVLVYCADGRRAVLSFLRRSADWSAMRSWAWTVAIATMPFVIFISALWLMLTGHDLPAFRFDPVEILALFALFLVAAMAEELGWSAYASRLLYDAHGLLIAGGILGAAAVLWHIIPLLQAGRAWDWIAWWALGTMARRIIILWLYIHGGQSVFAVSLFHAMGNLSWMMFPVMGSHFHPPSVAMILVIIAAPILIWRIFEGGSHEPT